MNPTPQQIASIKQFVGALAGVWSNTDEQIRSAMASAQVTNPAARATVQAPYAASSLLGLLSSGSAANVESFPAVGQLFDDIIAMNNARVLSAIALMSAAGRITSAEASAMTAAVDATGPDPNWTATVPWDVANLGRVADDFDIEAARHN